MSERQAGYVFVNGRAVPAARARVSVFDRGLLYGDGVFETLRAYRGLPFALDEHVTRLQASALFLGLIVPHRPWADDIRVLLQRNGLERTDAWVRITLTRGVGRGLLPPQRTQPTLIVAVGRLDAAIARAQRRGVRVTLLPFDRTGFLAEHKVLNYLPGILGKVIAARHRAFEAIFVDARKRLTEGTTSNLFIWRGDHLHTPARVGILSGITRRRVIEAATLDGTTVRERAIGPDDLLAADEAFLTSSLAEIIPVTAVDARTIREGKVGPRTRRLQQLYRQMVDQALARPRQPVTLRRRTSDVTLNR